MAFVTVLDARGAPMLIHTSMIGIGMARRPARAVGDWADVWRRADQQRPQERKP